MPGSVKVTEITACPLCSSTDLARFDVGAGNLLQRCRKCEAVSAPEYGDPAEIYVDGYMFGETAFGIDVRDPAFQEYLMQCAVQRFEHLERHAGGRGSLLDVGSGTGEVLATGRDRGWQVQGVEPESTAAEMARGRGLDVVTSMLEQAGVPEESWDVVSAFHVLEHIPDPVEFLRTLARWARPGGHLVIEVPNFASRDRKLRHEGWMGLRPLEHINHFTPMTLEHAFRRAALEPVAVSSATYPGPPQTLEQALWDLGRGPRAARALAPLSSRRRGGGETEGEHDPTPLGWSAVKAISAAHDKRGLGAVVLGVARVPHSARP